MNTIEQLTRKAILVYWPQIIYLEFKSFLTAATQHCYLEFKAESGGGGG